MNINTCIICFLTQINEIPNIQSWFVIICNI